jgi:hypothetical protein
MGGCRGRRSVDADTARRGRLGARRRRARTEGPLERVLQPVNLFQAEYTEVCELRAAPACAIFAKFCHRHVM